MILITIAAILAVCSADKLDRTYLPPLSAQTAGGSPGSIQAPFPTTRVQGNQGLGGFPSGSYQNEFDGVVVDAAAAGTRTNEPVPSGLGGSRNTYGSMNSKVGEAAFKVSQPNKGFSGQPSYQGQEQFSQLAQVNQGFGLQGGKQPDNSSPFQGFAQADAGASQFANAPQRPERLQAAGDRNANIIRYQSDVDTDKFNYAFETDNGIAAEENGVDNNGLQAQGGYSYTGDDGQVYSVTYTADERGYLPQGSHIPTPPPIPEAILKALEKNAQDEAAGIMDDGSYNAQKYNAGSGYTQSENNNGQYNRAPTNFGSRPGLNNPSGSLTNQNNLEQFGSDQSEKLVSNNSPDFSANPSLQTESQSGQSQLAGNNFAFNNDNKYSPASNRFQNGKPALNKPQENSNIFDASAQAEDQGQGASVKPESSNTAPNFGFGSNGNRRPSFGNFNQNRPLNTFGQNRQPDPATPQNLPIETDNADLLLNSQPTQPSFSQQNKPVGFDRFSGMNSAFNNEYLPPFNSFNPNSRPQQSSNFESSKETADSIVSSQPSRPNFLQQSQFSNFQQNVNSPTPNRFSSSFGKPSRFGSKVPQNNAFDRNPTSPPDTTLTTPFESYSNQDATTISDFEGSGPSRVEAEAQKEQFNNLQTAPTTPSSLFASSFDSNQQRQQNKRPSYSQSSQYQNADDSYYYNQPSQPFNTPTQTQGGRFPSLPSNQFNSPFGSNFGGQQFPGSMPSTTVTYPKPPTVAPTVPTSSTQKDLGLKPIPQFGGITDATASSFSSDSASNGAGQNISGQRPSFGKPASQTNFGTQTNEQEAPEKEPVVSSQQYQGEIYEYKKPAMTFPAQPQPEKETSEQSFSSFGNTPLQSQFPSRPQFGQNLQLAQNTGVSSQSGLQTSEQDGSVQPPPSGHRPPCCKRPPGPPSVNPVGGNLRPQSPNNQDSSSSGFNSNFLPTNSNFAGNGEAFGGPRRPPSFDAQTGYHY